MKDKDGIRKYLASRDLLVQLSVQDISESIVYIEHQEYVSGLLRSLGIDSAAKLPTDVLENLDSHCDSTRAKKFRRVQTQALISIKVPLLALLFFIGQLKEQDFALDQILYEIDHRFVADFLDYDEQVHNLFV